MKKYKKTLENKSESKKIDEEIKEAYKEMPAKKHNDFDKLIEKIL